MIIRKARKSDISELNKLMFHFNKEIQKNSPLNKLKSQIYDNSKNLVEDYFNKNSIIYLVEAEKILGFVSGRIIKQEDKQVSKFGKIDDLYILREARGKGFSNSLIDQINIWFKKNKCKYVVVFASNKMGMDKYYEKKDFKTVYSYMLKDLK